MHVPYSTMEPSFDIWTILFLIAAAQGVFLSIILWMKPSPDNRYLPLVVLLFSLMLGYYVAFWTGYARELPNALGILQGLTYLFAPLFYAFIAGHNNQAQLHKSHLIPFALFMIFYLVTTFWRFENMRFAWFIQNVIQIAHLMIYSGLAIYHSRQASVVQEKWKTMLVYLFGAYALSFLLYDVMVWSGTLQREHDYWISLFSTVFIYTIGYTGYQLPEKSSTIRDKKYDKSGLSESASASILKEVKRFMENDKGYLNNDLSLQQLSAEISISSNYISQAINELERCNFHEFVNKYRVEEAKKLLKQDSSRLKIIQIAYLAGFNNKATFNSAFKKFVGIPPSLYRKL